MRCVTPLFRILARAREKGSYLEEQLGLFRKLVLGTYGHDLVYLENVA